MATHTSDTKMATDNVPDNQVEFAAEKEFATKEETVSEFTRAQEKRIVRRIDLRLAVTLGVLYCISLLDRTNLGAASVAGYVPIRVSASACLLPLLTNRPECRWI